MAHLYGCAPSSVVYNYPAQFQVGDIVYRIAKAKKGCLEPVEVRDIRLINNKHGYFLFYLDKDNWKYQDWEVCDEATAKGLAIAYWEMVVKFAQELIC